MGGRTDGASVSMDKHCLVVAFFFPLTSFFLWRGSGLLCGAVYLAPLLEEREGLAREGPLRSRFKGGSGSLGTGLKGDVGLRSAI